MDGRHHRAVQVIVVPVPVAGSPETFRTIKPPAYPHQQRDHWRSQRSIPVKQRKAERLIEFMGRVQEQDNEVRAFMRRAGAST